MAHTFQKLLDFVANARTSMEVRSFAAIINHMLSDMLVVRHCKTYLRTFTPSPQEGCRSGS